MDKNKKTIILYIFLGIGVIIAALISSAILIPRMKAETAMTDNTSLSTMVSGSASFSFIRSGSGMSTIIESSDGQIIVIDTGSGENTLLQDYINGRTISACIITCWDSTHNGGLEALISTCEVGKIYVPESSGILESETSQYILPEKDEIINIGDILVKFEDCQMENLVPLVVHGENRLLFQGNQSLESAKAMANENVDLSNNQLSGIVLSNNGLNEYFSEDLLKKTRPTFVIANISLIDQSYNKVDEYVRNNDIDFYNFTYNESIPLHFTSTGKEIQFIGFE